MTNRRKAYWDAFYMVSDADSRLHYNPNTVCRKMVDFCFDRLSDAADEDVVGRQARILMKIRVIIGQVNSVLDGNTSIERIKASSYEGPSAPCGSLTWLQR